MKPLPAVAAALTVLAAAGFTLTAAPASAAPARGPGTPVASNPGAAAADAFMRRRTPSLKATSTDIFTRGEARKGTNGLQYFPYSRKHAGLPVVGGDVVVATDAKHRVVDSNVAQDAPISVPTTATVPASSAARTARARLSSVDRSEVPRLVVTAVGPPHLAWEVVVTGRRGKAPSARHVFVDARSGRLVGEYDDVVAGTGHGFYSGPGTTVPTSPDAGGYTMVDTAHPGTSCSDQTAQPFKGADDLWGNGAGTNLETACVDVLHGVDKEWQMLGSWLGRNGIDGKGHGFPAHVGLDESNAWWNNDWANFGHSADGTQQATSLDLVGHEYGHGIFGSTGLGGSGALNEGSADIFGTLTEHYANDPTDTPDYLIGERVNLSGPGAVRSMYDPASIGGGVGCWSAAVETMEPHDGAGVLNHWFYLLAEGSAPAGKPASPICPGGPASLTGMGQLPAAKIFYNAVQMKSYSWVYADARITTLQAARNLYPSSCTEFTKVKNAWNAVAVPAQPGEPTCPASTGTFGISLSNPTTQAIAGQEATFSLDSTLNSGTGRQITWSATGLPSGVTVAFSPSRVMAGATTQALLTVPTSVPGGTYSIVFTGTSGTEVHTVTGTLTIYPWRSDDFAVSAASTTMSMRAGLAGSLPFTTQITSGSPGSLYLTVDPRTLPTGVTVSFDPSSLAAGQGSTVTVSTTLQTQPGTYPLVVTVGGSYSKHNLTLTYTVTPANLMAFDIAPSASIPAGTSAGLPVTSRVLSGVPETVTWSMGSVPVPPGITATYSPASGPAGSSTTLTLTVAASVPPGDYLLRPTGTTATETVDRGLFLTVTPSASYCSGYTTTTTGTLSAGATQDKPSFSAASGTHKVCLDGPTGTDFDLYLQKLSGTGTWTTVASSATSNADEKVSYTGTSGTYRYRVKSYSGSGSYTLAYTRP